MSIKPFEDGLVEGCNSPLPLVLRRRAGRTEPGQAGAGLSGHHFAAFAATASDIHAFAYTVRRLQHFR